MPTPLKLYGCETPALVVAGHSHATSLYIALRLGLVPEHLRACLVWFGDNTLGPWEDDYWELFVQTAARRTAAVVWMGNQHSAFFLIEPEPPIAVWGEGCAMPDDADRRVWIPQTMVREVWEPTIAPLDELLERLAPVSTPVVVGTPPPKPRRLIQEQKLLVDPFVRDKAAALGISTDELEITPDGVRKALWHVLQDMLRERALKFGATFVPSPAAAVDGDGMLAPEYTAGDATHTNHFYGALVWEALAEVVQEPGT